MYHSKAPGQRRKAVAVDESGRLRACCLMDLPDPEIVALPGGSARVAWRRSLKARRVSLRIDPCDGSVVVTLPPRAGRRAGLALLTTHAAWVSDRLAALPAAVAFIDGASVPIGGVPHIIHHRPEAHGAAWLADGELNVTGRPEFLARRVGDFLRAEAGRRLSALALRKAAAADATIRRLTIKDTRTRWGSCTADGAMAFCWRLVMAPDFVQDYVAAHEVAHLRHMNHGPRFWALVNQLTPHTEEAIPWLHNQGSALLRIG
jgi:predicted metal-dependent hydrolase